MAEGRSRPSSFEDSGRPEKRGRKELVGDKNGATSRDRRGRRGKGRLRRNLGKKKERLKKTIETDSSAAYCLSFQPKMRQQERTPDAGVTVQQGKRNPLCVSNEARRREIR